MNPALEVQDLREHILCSIQELMDLPTQDWLTEEPDTSDMGLRMIENQRLGLRLSHGIDCARRQWLAHHEDKESNPSPAWVQLVKFSIGDLWEAWTHKMLPHCCPPGWVYQDMEDAEVTVDGIKGHLDGLFVNAEKGICVISDSKMSAPSRHKDWDDGMPDSGWGALHQAGNYIAGLKAAPIYASAYGECIGYVWPTIIPTYVGPWKYDVGYATAVELLPWRKSAAKQYADAQSLPTPPPRNAEFPKGKCQYCNLRDTCKAIN